MFDIRGIIALDQFLDAHKVAEWQFGSDVIENKPCLKSYVNQLITAFACTKSTHKFRPNKPGKLSKLLICVLPNDWSSPRRDWSLPHCDGVSYSTTKCYHEFRPKKPGKKDRNFSANVWLRLEYLRASGVCDGSVATPLSLELIDTTKPSLGHSILRRSSMINVASAEFDRRGLGYDV